jgi:DNA-binding MarR family transcriptional regulator
MWTEPVNSEMEYQFNGDESRYRAQKVLHALSLYRASEAAMRRRVRETVGLGESDVLALRFLLRSQLEGRTVAPKDISSYLGISSASTTAMLDRLERSGRLRREISPTDRRALVIVPTVSNEDEIRGMLGEVQPGMLDVVNSLDPAAAQIVINFLDEMQSAVDSIEPGE